MEFTKLSSKGQVVIPQEIRQKMQIKEGTPFMVSATSDAILLTKIDTANPKTWDEATKPFRKAVEELNFNEKDVERMVREVRRKNDKNSQ